jgi:biofilm PGA synthesis protein PgaA
MPQIDRARIHPGMTILFAASLLCFSSHAQALAGGRSSRALSSIEALRDGKRYPEALQYIETALASDPDNADLLRLQVLTLEDMGGSERALDLMRQHPQLFARYERERIENDRIAARIRWGEEFSQQESQRLVESTDALRRLRNLQQNNPRVTKWQATRLRVDALSALNHLQRHREVVDGYRALLDDHIVVPNYILPTVADSMMALRRPKDASQLLQAYLRIQPSDVNAQILLAYAWIEQERFDRALPLLERMSGSQMPWPTRKGARSGYQNWDKYSADVTLAMARAYANDNEAADRALHALATIAPANAALQAALGSVAARRLRPALALQRYAMALTLDPRERDARLGEVDALVNLQRVDEAKRVLAELKARYPEEPRVPLQQHSLDLQRGWQFSFEKGQGHSSGVGNSASPYGNRDGELSFEADSPLIDDRWRFALLARNDWAQFAGETARFRGAGIGLRYIYDQLSMAINAIQTNDAFGHDRATIEASADWRFSDAWHGTLELDKNDSEASLQARRFGITANSVTIGARYVPSDVTDVQTLWKHLRYDDGNRRDQLSVDADQRIFAQPHFLVDGIMSASVSRSSQGDVEAYFNPRRDASMAFGVRLDHVDWRAYERSYHELLDVTVGPYWQYGYGTSWIPTVSYRHRWLPQEGNQFVYGLSWSRPVYDGRRESRVALNFSWHWGATR